MGGEVEQEPPDPELLSSSSAVGSKRRLFFFKGVRDSFRSLRNGSASCEQ